MIGSRPMKKSTATPHMDENPNLWEPIHEFPATLGGEYIRQRFADDNLTDGKGAFSNISIPLHANTDRTRGLTLSSTTHNNRRDPLTNFEFDDFSHQYLNGELGNTQLFPSSLGSSTPSSLTTVPQSPQTTLTALQRGANNIRNPVFSLISGIVRAYPKMLLRKNTLPPFIHPSSSFPEPLAICLSIAQMFNTRTDASRAFIDQTIDSERQRLVDEVCATVSFCSFQVHFPRWTYNGTEQLVTMLTIVR